MDKCNKSDLIVEVKAKRKPGFKAGADLSSKVNYIGVDVNEELLDEHELVELKVHIFREKCAMVPCDN